MLEELLNNLEYSKSILLIDTFKNKAEALFYAFITQLLQRENQSTQLYPTNKRAVRYLEEHFSSKTEVNLKVLENLFEAPCIFKVVNEDLTASQDAEHRSKVNICIDNANLLLNHYNDNSFNLMHFIIESNRKPEIGTIVTILHREAVDDSVTAQLKSVFQTVITVTDTCVSLNELNQFTSLNLKDVYKYHVEIENRNFKKGKVYSYEETVFLSDKFKLIKAEKHLKTIKSKEAAKANTTSEKVAQDLLKDLTFNVHSNSEDMEAKKNLILPYEILGSGVKSQQQQAPHAKKSDEASKIYYAPDERDDFDDEDPDEDLNF